jgi:PII-like signaling protein
MRLQTIEGLCFLRGRAGCYNKDKEDRLSQLSFETPACLDMSLEAEELN